MKRLKNKHGFTLLEMLACVVTLIMITLICTAGLNLSVKSYNESLFVSNSQMLESMLHTSIGDVLRYADSVNVTETGVTFHNGNFDVTEGYFKVNDKGYVILAGAGNMENLLVGSKAYADGLRVDSFQLAYDAATNVFTGSYTIKSTVVAQTRQVTFSFKSILESI